MRHGHRVTIRIALVAVVAAAAEGAGGVPCAAETLEADSRIVSVTVFPDRALVTRTAALKLDDEEPYDVRFAPLPGALDAASVTARGSGDAKVVIYGVQVVSAQLEGAQDPTVYALEEEIRRLGRRQEELRHTKQVLQEEREYLASIQAASSEQIGKELVTKAPSVDDAAKLLAFLDESLLKLFVREQQADAEIEALQRQVDKLQRELASLTHGRQRQTSTIVVSMDVKDDGHFLLEVSYQVPGAMWAPAYAATAQTSSDQVTLASYAVIRQRTGEDWPNVQLTVSTAKPSIAGSMPKLEPWFLTPWEAVPIHGLASGTVSKMRQKDEVVDAPAEGILEEAEVAYATIGTQGPAVTFQSPKPATLNSDWQPRKLPLASQFLAAQLAYEATPKLSPYAFLRAKVTNTSEAFYLPGEVAVFLDGTFVSTAQLEAVAPGETFDLYLGVDERLKIERKQLKERVEVSLLPGLRGKTKSTDYEYLTTIENFTGRTVALTVFDHHPVSQREEIIVESIRMVPEAIEKDDEKPGVFRWALDLVPGQKQELRLAFRVRHPVDLQVQ